MGGVLAKRSRLAWTAEKSAHHLRDCLMNGHHVNGHPQVRLILATTFADVAGDIEAGLATHVEVGRSPRTALVAPIKGSPSKL